MKKDNKMIRTRLTTGAIIISTIVWLLFVIFAHHSYVMLSEGFISSFGLSFDINLNVVAIARYGILMLTAMIFTYVFLITVTRQAIFDK